MKSEIQITESQMNTVLAKINEEVAHFQIYEGGFINQIYEITTKNHTDLILRLTNPLPKWVRWKTRNEIEVMSFLLQNTSIPVPKLLDASDNTELIGYEYLLMDKVPGTQMNLVYPTASPEVKCDLLSELLSYIAQMQKFTFPQIGSFRQGFTIELIPDIEAGPFSSIPDFLKTNIDSRIKDLEQLPRFSQFVPRLQRFVSSLEQQEIEPHPFVLTHSDLGPKNILVQDGKITAVLDFEWAGAFPDYFELMNLPETYELDKYPSVKELFMENVESEGIGMELSDQLRDFHEIESLSMCLASYPAWFIGKESEGEEFAIQCTQELDALLKKYLP